jgi:hypothetical protein
MLILDGKPLSYDRAFTHDAIQYPANWLRLASLEEKTAIGITEVADAPSYDQRFYWGVDNPKQLNDQPAVDEDGKDLGYTQTGLKTQWSATQGEIAASLLAPSDWRIIKAKETGTNIPSAWKTYRAAVRTACNARQTEIGNAADVPALIELLYGAATITQQKKDSEGVGVVEPDTITNEAGETVANPVAGDPVMETVANPAIATAWPTPI